MKIRPWFAVLLVAVATGLSLPSAVRAQLFWDTSGSATDSSAGGSGAPSAMWDTVTSNWNTDGTDTAGSLTTWNNGTAVFSAASDATGTYTITLDSTAAISADQINFDDGTVTISGGVGAGDQLILTNTAGVDVASGLSATISSIVGGFSQISKNGAGTLDLTAANAFSGMLLNAGTVRVNNNNALGVNLSNVTIADGTTLAATAGTARTLTYAYSVAGNFTLGQASGGTGALTLGGASGSGATMDLGGAVRTITVNNGSDTISASISNGGITKEGTGTLTLNAGAAANTYTGAITVNAGILASSAATGLGTSAGGVTVNSGGTLQVSGGNTQPDAIVLNGTGSTGSNGALRKTGANTTTLSGQISGTGAIAITAGTLRLTSTGTANSGYTGDYNVTGGGTLRFEFVSPSQLGPSGVLTLDNGTLRNDNTSTTAAGSMLPSGRTVTLGSGGGTLFYNTVAANLTDFGFSIVNPTSIVSGTGSLTKTGVGAIGFAAPSTYTGDTIVSEGELRLRSGTNRLPVTTNLIVNSPGILNVNGSGQNQTVASLSGNGRVGLGNGTLTINGTSSTTYSGTIEDTAFLNTPAAAGTTTTGGKITKNGSGTLTLTGSNLYTGVTTITAGTLLVNNTSGSGTGTGAVTISAAGTLGGTGTIAGAITNNGTIAPGASVGTLTASSNVTNGANSHWAIELDGTSSDQLVVGGNINLSAVDFLDVTGTGSGSGWVIATYAGTLTGTFDTVTAGYTIDYGTGSASQITLNAVGAGLPGDFNNDSKVDAADYVTWRINETANLALPNDNGVGNQPARYSLWSQNFGNPGAGGGPGRSAAAPEPVSVAMLLTGVAILGLWRRRA
jgi:autotransporter-associated beta strand protein